MKPGQFLQIIALVAFSAPAAALAAALAALLLHALPLRAQHPDFYLQPDTLVFGYSAGLVESVYVTCDIDLRWYVSNPQAGGDLFAIDVYEGVSSDFIQVRTLQSNRTGSDRRCTLSQPRHHPEALRRTAADSARARPRLGPRHPRQLDSLALLLRPRRLLRLPR